MTISNFLHSVGHSISNFFHGAKHYIGIAVNKGGDVVNKVVQVGGNVVDKVTDKVTSVVRGFELPFIIPLVLIGGAALLFVYKTDTNKAIEVVGRTAERVGPAAALV